MPIKITNEIEEALSRIEEIKAKHPLENPLTPAEIDACIVHDIRALRAYEAGVKPKKSEGPKLTLADLGDLMVEKKIVRRKL